MPTQKTCSVGGCPKFVFGRGWCRKHYQRWYRYGDPNTRQKVWDVKEPTIQPTDVDLGWIAGFLEGEGSFSPNGTCGTVRAAQVHKPPVEKLQALLGGSLRLKPRYGNENDIWIWALHGEKAQLLMKDIYHLMSPKRQEQIKAILV